MLEDISNLDKRKLDAETFDKSQALNKIKLREIDDQMSEQNDNIKTLEHYTERYVPIQV